MIDFLQKKIQLPKNLTDETAGNLHHWRYNGYPSDAFSPEESLQNSHFVISLQYRIRAGNSRGKSEWHITAPVPVCSIVPDLKAKLKYPVVDIKPYLDSSSFAKTKLTELVAHNISHVRDYTHLMVRPEEIESNIKMAQVGSEPTTRGTTAASL